MKCFVFLVKVPELYVPINAETEEAAREKLDYAKISDYIGGFEYSLFGEINTGAAPEKEDPK